MQQLIYGGVTAHLEEESTTSLARSTEGTSKAVPLWQAHQVTQSL